VGAAKVNALVAVDVELHLEADVDSILRLGRAVVPAARGFAPVVVLTPGGATVLALGTLPCARAIEGAVIPPFATRLAVLILGTPCIVFSMDTFSLALCSFHGELQRFDLAWRRAIVP